MNFLPVKISSAIGIVLIIAAYFYRRHLDDEHLKAVLSGLLRAENAVELDPRTRVAVGFGSCVDVIGPGLEVLSRLGATPPENPEHYDMVNDVNEFEKIFAYFFRHGAAAERYMTNESLFHKMSDIAKSLPETKVVVGGNAPVMVNGFRREGLQVLLGAQMTDYLRSRVDTKVEIAGNDVDEDDIHLILEYKKGETWGKYTAPRANRFIIHNDVNNPLLATLESFAASMKSFLPHLLVIGGLQMMDGFPYKSGQRRGRLDKLSEILSEVPSDTRIHFEMASFAEQDCLKDIIETVVYYSDSLGMNEQELPNLVGMVVNHSITVVSDPHPRVATTLDEMRTLYRSLRDRELRPGMRAITRLHVHTLAFQAIMTERGSSWKHSMSAAAKAALMANRHTCGSSSISTSKSRLLMDESFTLSNARGSERVPFQSDEPVSCWQEGDVDICLAPVLVCTDVVQTVGGGDNISSAGLVLQI